MRYVWFHNSFYALLKNKATFKWSPECQNAFDNLKRAITSAPCLGLPNVSDPLNSYELHLDASKDGFGGMLTQIVDGDRRIISYFSKAVPKHQKNWPPTKLEFMCLHACCMHYRMFLQGAKMFKVFTDCQSLLNFDTIFSRGNAHMQRKLAK